MRRSYAEVKLVDSYEDITSDFVKITVYDENKQCPTIRPQLSHFDEQAYIVVSEAAWIDIANAGVHKGTTVERLQSIVGATEAETMVFGDGFNDIELMERAHFSFAMRVMLLRKRKRRQTILPVRMMKMSRNAHSLTVPSTPKKIIIGFFKWA
ncbi:HAD hydrolase family protein [Vibrio sp. M60_M31a]